MGILIWVHQPRPRGEGGDLFGLIFVEKTLEPTAEAEGVPAAAELNGNEGLTAP